MLKFGRNWGDVLAGFVVIYELGTLGSGNLPVYWQTNHHPSADDAEFTYLQTTMQRGFSTGKSSA